MRAPGTTRRTVLVGGSLVGAALATPAAGATGRTSDLPAAGPAPYAVTRAPGPAWHVGAGATRHVLDPSRGGVASYVNDHTLVRGRDGTWHLFGIVGPRARPGEAPDSGREHAFVHATAPHPTGPWTRHADALVLDPTYFSERHLWAPHVIEVDGRYLMFFTGGGGDAEGGSAISLATSPDLWTWTRDPGGPLFRGPAARDPMVLRVGDVWAMYYTDVVRRGGAHVVAYRTSSDLRRWSAPGSAFTDATTELDNVSVTESPYVVERDGWFHLFVGPRNGYVGTDVLRSADPFSFALDGWAGHVPLHAAEVVRHDDEWWATGAGWFQRGLHVAPLEWRAGATPWQSPDAVALGAGVGDRLHAFALAGAGAAVGGAPVERGSVLRRELTGRDWGPWEVFGTPAGAVPTLGRDADGRLEVFSLALGGRHLHHRAQRADGSWTDWVPFGEAAGAAPAVAADADGRLHVLALGPGGANVAVRRQSAPGSTTWEPWEGWFAGRVGAPPVLAANADGRLEAFVLGPGASYVGHRWQTVVGGGPGDWSAWTRFGTSAGGAPRVAQDGSGRLVVAAPGPSGLGSFTRTQSSPSGTWRAWEGLGSWTLAAPALAADGAGGVHAVALAPGGERVVVRRQPAAGSAFGPEQDLTESGVLLAATPGLALDAADRLWLVAVTTDGRVRSRVRSAGGTWGAWSAFGDVAVAPVPAGSPT